MKELILVIWLGIQGYIDFKYKEIPFWFSVLGGCFGVGICMIEDRTIIDVLCSSVPGLLALGFSRVTEEIMGYGDGIVLVVLGIYLPIGELLSMVMLAFFIAGIVSLVLLVIFRRKGNDRIPFIPFLSLAYLLVVISQIGEHMV